MAKFEDMSDVDPRIVRKIRKWLDTEHFDDMEKRIDRFVAGQQAILDKLVDDTPETRRKVIAWCSQKVPIPPVVERPAAGAGIDAFKQWINANAERMVALADAKSRSHWYLFLTTTDGDLH
jgi:hypothetical protein